MSFFRSAFSLRSRNFLSGAGRSKPRAATRQRPRLEQLEDRLTPSSTNITFVDDNWVDLSRTSGAPQIGDFIQNLDDAINPGGITAAYGITGFGTVITNAPGTAAGAATINDAIANTNAGGTVNVLEGTYNESVTVNKSLHLLGAEHGVDARTRNGVESVVDNASNGGKTGFVVAASDVTIDGFTIQNSTSSNQFGPAVFLAPGTSGSHVVNDVIQGSFAGLFLANANAMDQTVVQHNLFRNNTSGLATDIYADQFGAGVGGVNNVLIDGNTFTNTSAVENSWALGISNTGATPFTDITFSNNSVTNHGRGVYFYNTTGATVSDNTFTGASHYALGIFGNNGTPTNASFTIAGNTFNVNGTGGAGVELVDDTAAHAYTGTLTLSGDNYNTSSSDLSILNESVTPIDATGETFNGVAASSATTAQLYAVEDTVVDAIDVSGFGLVRLKAGNVYVTANSFYAPDGTTTPSIQRGIDAASAGDTVNVAAGTYSGLTTITKTVTLLGAEHGVDARTRSAVPETIVSNSEGDFQIEADNVVIDGFTLEGVTSNPSTDPASLGVAVWTNPGFSGTHGGEQIVNNIIQGNIAGIELDNDGTFQAKVQFNRIENNNQTGAGSGNGIQVNFGLSNALIDSNKFAGDPNAAMVVEAPSQGITFSNNQADSGVALFDVTSAQLTGNTMTGLTTDGFDIGGGDSGITVSGNTITGVGSGSAALVIENAFSVGANSSVTVTNNTFNINGQGGAAVAVKDDGTPGSAYTGTLTLSGDRITTSGSDLSILNESTTPIDATGETFNGVAASSATTAQLFAAEDTIVDAIDVSGFGLVRLKAGNVYVTPNSFYAPDGTTGPSIQRGVDAASAGDTVNVEGGIYHENLTIDKNLTLTGNPASPTSVVVHPTSGDGVAIASPAANVTVENLEVTGAANGVAASGSGTVTLTDLTLTGNVTGFSASGLTTLNLSDLTLTGNTTAGGSISNVPTVNDTPSSGSTGVTITITGATFQRGTDQAVHYTGVASLNVTGSGGADTFNVTPAAATTITVHGGLPTPPASPGDALAVTLAGATNPKLTETFNPSTGNSGTWTFGNRASINFDGIETVTPSAPDVAVLKTNGELDLLTPSGSLQMISPAGTIQAVSSTFDGSFNNDVFAIVSAADGAGRFHTLWEYSDAFGWKEISSGSFQQISATTNASGQSVVFGVLTDGSLWEQNPAGAGLNVGWTELSTAGTIASVSTVTDSTGAVVAFAVVQTPGYTGTLWEHTDAAGWKEESSGSFQKISAGLNASGQAIVFGIVSDGSLWEQDPAGAGLDVGWTKRLNSALSETAGGAADEAFVIEADQHLYQLTPSGLTQLSTRSFSSVSATETQAGQDEVFAVMTDSSFWEYSPTFPGDHFQQILASGVESTSVPPRVA